MLRSSRASGAVGLVPRRDALGGRESFNQGPERRERKHAQHGHQAVVVLVARMAIDKSAPKLSSGEKAAAKKEQAKINKAKANPAVAAENKAKSDAKRERRKEAGTSKTFK